MDFKKSYKDYYGEIHTNVYNDNQEYLYTINEEDGEKMKNIKKFKNNEMLYFIDKNYIDEVIDVLLEYKKELEKDNKDIKDKVVTSFDEEKEVFTKITYYRDSNNIKTKTISDNNHNLLNKSDYDENGNKLSMCVYNDDGMTIYEYFEGSTKVSCIEIYDIYKNLINMTEFDECDRTIRSKTKNVEYNYKYNNNEKDPQITTVITTYNNELPYSKKVEVFNYDKKIDTTVYNKNKEIIYEDNNSFTIRNYYDHSKRIRKEYNKKTGKNITRIFTNGLLIYENNGDKEINYLNGKLAIEINLDEPGLYN